MSDNEPQTEQNQQPTPPAKTPPVETTFTQADLNAHAGNARKEGREKAINDLLKELELEKADDLKALVTEARKRKKDEMTEAERLSAELTEANKKLEAANQRAAQAETARIADQVNARIEKLAKGASNPEDVTDFIRARWLEQLNAAVSEDGKVDEKAIEKLVADVRKERPAWFAISGQGSPSNRDGRPPQPDDKAIFGNLPKVRF